MKRYTFEKHLKIGDKVTETFFSAHPHYPSPLVKQKAYEVVGIENIWITIKDNNNKELQFSYKWIELYSTKIPTDFHNSCSCNEYWDMLGLKRIEK